MVRRFAFAVPGDLATPTGGYGYDRRMMAELGDLGWQIELIVFAVLGKQIVGGIMQGAVKG